MSALRPEILAPAGDAAAMHAAVAAGADAVYFGLQEWSARARADNFAVETLAATMGHLHESGVRGYVALNTLVFDPELPKIETAVRACAAAGVDAVIVQDLGVARLVRAVAPALPIHASTQMTCTDAAGVDFAASMGASRVILARELSLDDIAAIRAATDVPLEVFVHGALCVAYSGQCLTSEAIGGRSANRGACAQACRLPYELVVDGAVRDLGDAAYLLSPEDLEATAFVQRLAALGVHSLKIEGRLKGPEYVAATVALYRAALRGQVTQADREHALQTFSRGSGPGFLGGVDHLRLVEGRTCDHRGLYVGTVGRVAKDKGRDWLVLSSAGGTAVAEIALRRGDGILIEGGWGGEGEIGGRVWDVDVEGAGETRVCLGPEKVLVGALVGRRVFRTSAPKNDDAARARQGRDRVTTPLAMTLKGRIGEPFELFAESPRGHKAHIVAEGTVEQARTTATPPEVLREKLGRLGDTPFSLERLTVDLPEGSMIPVSLLNRARRALVEVLERSTHVAHATTAESCASLLASAALPDLAPPPAGLFVLCRTLDQAHAAVDAKADGVILDFLELTGAGAALRAIRARSGGVQVVVAPPRIRKPGEDKIDRYLSELKPDAILVRSLGALHEGEGTTATRIGDFSLNVTNRLSAAEVLSRGLSAFTPSFDLDAAQLTALCSTGLGPWVEAVVHHPMPLFHMEHCLFAAHLSQGKGKDHRTCGRPCEHHAMSLRDRAGMQHPVMADIGCRNTVFHAASQSAASVLPSLENAGVRRYRIELLRESADDVGRLVETYRAGLAGAMAPSEVWRALKTRGGYGVVSGSLRVV